MRITRFLDDRGTLHRGVDLGDGSADICVDGADEPTGRVMPIARRLAPVVPSNIFCIGHNYRAHIEETGAQVPKNPVLFMKPTSAVNDPGAPIVIPACCTRGDEVDYECELAVVIGTAGRDIPVETALEHVAGYTAANDVSARRWQKHGGGGQFIRGKSFDTFCPLGPVLVTSDELPDPQTLDLSTTVNGEVRQSSNTADMLFSVAELISFISQDTTLLPNTVILTGTPQGVGVARDPQVFLQPGDEVTVEIQGIGALRNPVAAAP